MYDHMGMICMSITAGTCHFFGLGMCNIVLTRCFGTFNIERHLIAVNHTYPNMLGTLPLIQLQPCT